MTQLQNDTTEMVTDANTIIIQTEIQKQIDRLTQPAPPAPTGPVTGGEETPPPPGDTRVGGTFDGYAIGFRESGWNGQGEPDFVSSSGADGVHIVLSPQGNSVTAGIKVSNTSEGLFGALKQTTTYNLGFAGNGDAYASDAIFGGGATLANSNVVKAEKVFGIPLPTTRTLNPTSHTGLFTSVPPQQNLPTSLCDDCGFLKWGVWYSNVTYRDLLQRTDKMGGWWVATDQPLAANHIENGGTATYEGRAIGTFSTKQTNWTPQVETGLLNMTWDFGQRSGDLRISEFAGKTFRSELGPNGVSGFGGDLRGGGGGARGFANGSFVGPNTNDYPKGVMGNFGIGNDKWKANGIFGGHNVPN